MQHVDCGMYSALASTDGTIDAATPTVAYFVDDVARGTRHCSHATNLLLRTKLYVSGCRLIAGGGHEDDRCEGRGTGSRQG